MQLECLAPPIANNRRISCEEASLCRRPPCNGRRSRCRWHWRRTSGLCLWNLSLRTWKDILQSESTSSFGILGLELEGWTEERSYNQTLTFWLALGTHYIFNNSSEAPNQLFLLPLTLVFWIIHWFLPLSSGDSNSSSFSFLPLFKKLSAFTDLYLKILQDQNQWTPPGLNCSGTQK